MKQQFSALNSSIRSGLVPPLISGRNTVSTSDEADACKAKKTDRWDRWGLVLSSLCALHCLLTPILLLSLPVWGSVLEQEWVHIGLAFFVLPVGLYAFFSGYRHHADKRVLALGLVGLALIVGATVVPHEWVEFQELDVVTIAGSLLLMTGHLLNRRACLKC